MKHIFYFGAWKHIFCFGAWKKSILTFRFRDIFLPETVESPLIKVVPFFQCSLLVATFSSSFLWDFVNSFTFFSPSLALRKPI